MNILVLTNSDSGLYQFRKEIIENLTRKHTVVCSVPNSDGYIPKLEELGCRCIPISIDRRSTNPITDLGLLKSYLNLINRTKPDVVLSYTIKPNVYGGIACRIKRIPLLANITGLGTTIENGGLLAYICKTLYRIGLSKAKCVFFQNTYNMRLFLDERIVKGNTRLIPGSGVNVETHQYENYPPDEKCFRFLFVGRVMKDKGIEELLQAIWQLTEEGKKAFLDIVGGCDEDYTKLLMEYEKQNIMKYHGQQKNVHDFYTKCHCAVLPSYHEGMANVMLEAASTGRPVIASRIPGCMETFNEGETGFGCEPKDIDSLLEAMRKMYDTPWNIRCEMGKTGRKKVQKEFDRQIIVKAYQEEIDSVSMH